MNPSKKITVAILITVFIGEMPLVAFSAERWLLMARHGECMEIERLKRKVPELADIGDPYSFVNLMRQKGHTVTSNEVPGTEGKAVEVKVPEKELSLVFATRELCLKTGAR